jgi:predicted RNA-binding protein with PUA-like domain
MKSEPDVFSIEDLRREGVAGWDGVRNYQARKNLRTMRKGDLAFFYQSSAKPLSIVGLMEIVGEASPDTTTDEPGWQKVDVKFLKKFSEPLTLEAIKRVSALQSMVLLHNTRLSVQPISHAEWAVLAKILKLSSSFVEKR